MSSFRLYYYCKVQNVNFVCNIDISHRIMARLHSFCILLLISSTLLPGCSSPVSPPTVALAHKIAFELNGGIFDHRVISYDSTDALTDAVTPKTGRIEYYANFEVPGSAPRDETTLEISLPSAQDGTYQWGNLVSDSTALGCTIIRIEKSQPGVYTYYKSISGQTTVRMFIRSNNTSFTVDSLFGTFSGQLKDPSGNLITVSNGVLFFGY